MIRAVLSVLVAVALLGASLPAVDDARVGRTETLVEADLRQLADEAAALAAESDAVETGPGARRVVALRVPGRDLTTAGATVELRGKENVAVARIEGRERVRITLDVDLRTPGGPVRLAEPGTHRVVLELRRVDGDPVVVASA